MPPPGKAVDVSQKGSHLKLKRSDGRVLVAGWGTQLARLHLIGSGAFDYVLLKPVDAQFIVSSQKYEPWNIFDILGAIGLCVFIGARDGDVALHLHRSMGRQRIEVATRPGTRRALADTGLGKALMFDDTPAAWARLFMLARPEQDDGAAAIDEMRAHVAAGVVLHHSTSDDTIRSVAAPVRDATGDIVAALSVASPVQYLDDQRMREIAPQVLQTAREISAALGWHGSDMPASSQS